ncbi:hypothetical protein quinque_002201 [Culex quinquefasciatus]
MAPQNAIEMSTKQPDGENGTKKVQNGDNKQAKNAEPPTTSVVVPPDGGWGWLVMIASFLCNTVVDGIVFSAGMFQDPIRLDFGVGKAEVALVSSLLSGFYLLTGPFVSALANRWGFRPVTIIGAVIASIGFVLSYYAQSLGFLYVTYGVIGGIGFCFIYVPSVITVGYYFEKWRALATGIALCGSGVGTFVFAPLSSMLIAQFGWRGALLVQAAIILLCALFGCIFRPIQPITVTLTKDEDTPAEKGSLLGDGLPVKRLAGQMTPEDTIHAPRFPIPHHELNTVGEAEEEETENGTLLTGEQKTTLVVPTSAPGARQRSHTVSGRRPNEAGSRQGSRRGTLTDGTRPMYRDDIFFTGSLVRIPQYQSTTSLGYHMSVTRLPTHTDVEEAEDQSCKICPEAVRRTLATMLDMTLLKSPSFMLLAVSGFFTMMGFFVPFMYISQRATSGGMDSNVALYIVSAIGISNTIARIVCGFLSSFKSVNALHLNNVAITMGGLATMASGLYITEAYQFTYAAIFGLAIACFSALRSILVVDLMGLEKLTNAFGILCLFQGLAAAIGAPIAGFFTDLTGSYDVSFYISGALITISAVLCYPLNMVNKWEKKRATNKKVVPA